MDGFGEFGGSEIRLPSGMPVANATRWVCDKAVSAWGVGPAGLAWSASASAESGCRKWLVPWSKTTPFFVTNVGSSDPYVGNSEVWLGIARARHAHRTREPLGCEARLCVGSITRQNENPRRGQTGAPHLNVRRCYQTSKSHTHHGGLSAQEVVPRRSPGARDSATITAGSAVGFQGNTSPPPIHNHGEWIPTRQRQQRAR